MLQIRPATLADYPWYARLFRELEVEDPAPAYQRWRDDIAGRVLIAERAGEIVGYISCERLAGVGYVRQLVVAPDARRTGVGTALMQAAADRLRAGGAAVAAWHLNVREGNTAAIRLYEGLGMQVEHRSVALRVAWDELDRLPADAAPMTAIAVDDPEVDELERAMDILPGRLAMARRRGDKITMQLRDAELAPVGVACFDPAFPGAFPFCVARPGLARPLLAALAPHARPGDPSVQVIIEDDDALAAALIAGGATVRVRLFHYAGPLPAAALRQLERQ